MKRLLFILSFSFVSLFAQAVTLEEMIAQMIVIGFDGTKEGDKWVDQVAKDIKRGKVGGVYVDAHNVSTPQSLKKMTEYLKAQASPQQPLMVVATVTQSDTSLWHQKQNKNELHSEASIAERKDIAEAFKIYDDMAKNLAQSGINVNLAPLLDLQPHNVKSAKEKEQSYSTYEEIVTAYASTFIDAMRANKIVPVVKYFPMAGENVWDDFSTKVDCTKQWRFEQLKPYFDLIAFQKVDGLLVAHSLCPMLDEKEAAPFSKRILGTLLRDKMHFEGVVFLDNLRSPSITGTMEFKRRLVKAIQAGTDVFIFHNYFAENASVPFTVNKIILDAIHSGELSQARIEQSYERVMRFKQNFTK